MHADDPDRYRDLNIHDFEQFKVYRFFETLFNNLRGGNVFTSLCFKDEKDKNIECQFEFEFYRKLDRNGLFIDLDDFQSIQ